MWTACVSPLPTPERSPTPGGKGWPRSHAFGPRRGSKAFPSRRWSRAPARLYARLALHPDPADPVKRLDAPGVTLRPSRPEDAASECELVEGLSARSSRLRFRSGMRSLTPSALARFTQIDYDREMA